MRLISSNDLNGWYSYLNQTKNTICGRHPVSVLLHTLTAASKKSEGQGECPSVQFVHYAQSNRCQSLQDSQVRLRVRNRQNAAIKKKIFI